MKKPQSLSTLKKTPEVQAYLTAHLTRIGSIKNKKRAAASKANLVKAREARKMKAMKKKSRAKG